MDIVKENVGLLVAIITMIKAFCTWCCRKTKIEGEMYLVKKTE